MIRQTLISEDLKNLPNSHNLPLESEIHQLNVFFHCVVYLFIHRCWVEHEKDVDSTTCKCLIYFHAKL